MKKVCFIGMRLATQYFYFLSAPCVIASALTSFLKRKNNQKSDIDLFLSSLKEVIALLR
jgi:hypothetical protein